MTTKIVVAPFIHPGNPNVSVALQVRLADGTWVDESPEKAELGNGQTHNGEYLIYAGRRLIIEELPRT